MKKELLFSETKESKKEYLSRMAILLDIIRNFPDLKASHPLLRTMDDTDAKEFENYLCVVVYKDVERTAKTVAANNSLLDYKDVIFSYLIMDVIYNLHKYNNPAYIDYMYRDAKKRLIGYIRDHGLRQQDLEGCLGDLLDEEWYKINM